MSLSKRRLFNIILGSFLAIGCENAGTTQVAQTPHAAANPNQELLDEVNAANSWFHAKKTKAIWARPALADETVETLEGTEKVEAGDYVCRGEQGELWPQKAASLEKKYLETDEEANGWRKYTPNPDTKGVMAAKIDHPFQVNATWGTLHGKAGDFLLKEFTGAIDLSPNDIWIVDETLFHATYQTVNQ